MVGDGGEMKGLYICRVFIYQVKEFGPFSSKTGDKENFKQVREQ